MSAYLMMEAPPSILSKIDGRAKLMVSCFALLAVVSSSNSLLPLGLGLLSLIILILAKIPYQVIWLRLRPVFYVALLIGITQVFFTGHTPWFEWNLYFFHLTGYWEGLVQGELLSSRVFGGMSVMLLMTLSTTVQEWMSTLTWFRVPLAVVEIMTLGYSSLFILLEELDRLKKAQSMRLGYSSWWKNVSAIASIGGILIIRVFDKSQRLWQAMVCRGYNGEIRVTAEQEFSTRDRVLTIVGIMLVIMAWFAGR